MAVTLIADARHWTIAGNFRLDPRGEPVGTERVFGICAYHVDVDYFTEVCSIQLLSVDSIPAFQLGLARYIATGASRSSRRDIRAIRICASRQTTMPDRVEDCCRGHLVLLLEHARGVTIKSNAAPDGDL